MDTEAAKAGRPAPTGIKGPLSWWCTGRRCTYTAFDGAAALRNGNCYAYGGARYHPLYGYSLWR
jgi:hypothetical protein